MGVAVWRQLQQGAICQRKLHPHSLQPHTISGAAPLDGMLASCEW